MRLNQLYNMPCEEGIAQLKERNTKIDCLITSPPYNVDLGNNKYNKNPYDLYRDNKEHNDYITWLRDIFRKCQDIMQIGGNVCINIGDGKNGNVPTHSDIIQFMTRELDYVILSTVIWNKQQCSNRTSWGSWLSPSAPSFPTPFEYILVFRYKSKHPPGNKVDITVTKEEFITNSLALWTFPPEMKQKVIGHPAMFPVELPRRLIQQLTYKNDIVMDIFSGAGTTAMAAKEQNRRFIGFELSKEYHNIAINRLEEV